MYEVAEWQLIDQYFNELWTDWLSSHHWQMAKPWSSLWCTWSVKNNQLYSKTKGQTHKCAVFNLSCIISLILLQPDSKLMWILGVHQENSHHGSEAN